MNPEFGEKERSEWCAVDGPAAMSHRPRQSQLARIEQRARQFDSDSVWSHELSEKARLDDRRIVVEALVLTGKGHIATAMALGTPRERPVERCTGHDCGDFTPS